MFFRSAFIIATLLASPMSFSDNNYRFNYGDITDLNIHANSTGVDTPANSILITAGGISYVERGGRKVNFKSCKEYIDAGFGFN